MYEIATCTNIYSIVNLKWHAETNRKLVIYLDCYLLLKHTVAYSTVKWACKCNYVVILKNIIVANGNTINLKQVLYCKITIAIFK